MISHIYPVIQNVSRQLLYYNPGNNFERNKSIQKIWNMFRGEEWWSTTYRKPLNRSHGRSSQMLRGATNPNILGFKPASSTRYFVIAILASRQRFSNSLEVQVSDNATLRAKISCEETVAPFNSRRRDPSALIMGLSLFGIGMRGSIYFKTEENGINGA